MANNWQKIIASGLAGLLTIAGVNKSSADNAPTTGVTNTNVSSPAASAPVKNIRDNPGITVEVSSGKFINMISPAELIFYERVRNSICNKINNGASIENLTTAEQRVLFADRPFSMEMLDTGTKIVVNQEDASVTRKAKAEDEVGRTHNAGSISRPINPFLLMSPEKRMGVLVEKGDLFDRLGSGARLDDFTDDEVRQLYSGFVLGSEVRMLVGNVEIAITPGGTATATLNGQDAGMIASDRFYEVTLSEQAHDKAKAGFADRVKKDQPAAVRGH